MVYAKLCSRSRDLLLWCYREDSGFPLPKWKASKQTVFVAPTKKAGRNGEGWPQPTPTGLGLAGVAAAAWLSPCLFCVGSARLLTDVFSLPLPPYHAVSPVRPSQWSTWVGSPSAWTSTTRSSHPAAFPGPSGTPLSTMPKAKSSPDTSQWFITSRYGSYWAFDVCLGAGVPFS